MHAEGIEARHKAKALTLAAMLGGVVAWFREAHAKWMPFELAGRLRSCPRGPSRANLQVVLPWASIPRSSW